MNSPINFLRNFLLPQLTVVGIMLIALFGLFWSATSQQNEAAREREATLIETGLTSTVEYISNNLRDYARWNDAVDNLAIKLDPDWADQNIGPYLYDIQGYSRTFVIDTKGYTTYSNDGPKRTKEQARTVLKSALDPILELLNSADHGVEERYAALAQLDSGPAIVAASPILPNPGTKYPAPYPRRYLIFVKNVDSAVFGKLAEDYDIAPLQFSKKLATQAELASVILRKENGDLIGELSWAPARPGDTTRDRTLPFLVLIALVTMGLAALVLKIAHRTTQDLAASEAAARHMANHDVLTGLPNRRALRARGITLASQPKAVLYLDLDGFKEVNDLFGHQAGDALLKEAVERLRHVVKDKGLLARVGGDEFSILLTGEHAHKEARDMAPRIVASLGEPFKANHIKMLVSASVGLSLGGPDSDVDDLARLADVAMYAAKARGKNRWQLYDPEMDEGRETRKLLESELREAVKRKEIDVVFQPIVDARSGKIICVEALARWISPTQGSVGPAIFVPIAEESGLIVDLGDLVLRKACMAARDWPVSLAVNLSPAQFWHQGLVGDVQRILDECQFPADRLELEITEGYLVSRPETATEIITQLRSLGIRLALDDFGTGFASIGYLRRFALDRIKLDRSFVDSVERDEDAMMVAQAVISLSHALKLPITAEGVENIAQSHMLTIAGCERLQGWHYGRPGQASDIGSLFRDSDQFVPDPEISYPPLRQVGKAA